LGREKRRLGNIHTEQSVFYREQVVAAVLGGEGARLSEEELDRIAELVEKAKKEGSR
jgi:hypothetical protein